MGHVKSYTEFINEDVIPGGLADVMKPKDFSIDQLQKGIEVEMEHTSDREIAMEIAMDHLAEDPKYYDKLETIHERVQRRGNKWVLLSKKGKVLGRHNSKKDALAQERAIWASKG